MSVWRLALVFPIGLLALTGCGRSGARTTVTNVAEGFYAAVAQHDGARACALLSPDTRKALEQQESAPCARAVVHLDLSGSRAHIVRVYTTDAAVELIRGDTVFLQETTRGWRVDAAGCRPQARGEPADCEVAS
ncbi:MAG TPA: hypothetical protein VH834_10970 [Solirubrobacteraceae bacterium]|jgi:hypothetical protein